MEGIEGELVAVTAADGAQSKVTVYREGTDPRGPVLLIMPAMGVHADYYAPMALDCVAAGWNAVTADLRGNGRSTLRVSREIDFGYHHLVEYDWPATVSAVKEMFPESPLYLTGHSLGGQLSALYLSRRPDDVTGLILIAAGSVYYRGWNFPESLGVLALTQFSRLISAVLGYYPGRRFGFGGTEAGTLIRDWAYQCRTGLYKLTGSPHDFEALLKTIRKPVLAFSFDDDGLTPYKAVRHLCGKMPEATVTHLHVKPRDLDLDELGHFKWVRNFKALTGKIESWMNGKA